MTPNKKNGHVADARRPRAPVSIAVRICALVSCGVLLSCSVYDEGLLPYGSGGGSDGGVSPFDGGMESSPYSVDGIQSSLDGSVPEASAQPQDGSIIAPPSDASSVLIPDADEDVGVEDGGRTCLQADVEDYCSELPALAAAPVIDGEPDCGPLPVAVEPVGWNGDGPAPKNLVTTLAAAWRSNGLYLYVEVLGQQPAPHPSGQSIYCGDAIELYVDSDGTVDEVGSYDSPGTMQFVVAAPSAQEPARIEAERFANGVSQGVWISNAIETVVLDDGYAVEVFITAADLGLWEWSPSDQIGFDLAIDVAGAADDAHLQCGLQLGQFHFRLGSDIGTCGGEPWCDSRAFCSPELLDR